MWVEFTHVESGKIYPGGAVIIAPDADPQTEADGLCAKVQRNIEQADYSYYRDKIEEYGIDPSANRPPVALTLAQIRKRLARRLVNNVQKNDAESISKVAKAYNVFKNATLQQWRDWTGLTDAELIELRNDLQAINDVAEKAAIVPELDEEA
jgi:hypothetical protein